MHRSIVRGIASAVLLAACVTSEASAGDDGLEATLRRLSADAAKAYVKPISSAFGADMNGGWFHSAPFPDKFSFDLEVGAVAMGTFFPKESKAFSVGGTFRFNTEQAYLLVQNTTYPQSVKEALVGQITQREFSVGIAGPTVIGSSTEKIQVAFRGETFTVNGQPYTVGAGNVELPVSGLKDLADIPLLPLIAPQVSIGTIYGTRLTFRYLPSIELNSDLGSFKYFGFGIQHNPSVWLDDPLPVDLSAMYFTQSMNIGSIFETKTTAFGLNASKRLGTGWLNLTPYVGFMLESSTITVGYDYVVDTPSGTVREAIRFDLEGENNSRLTLGANAKLLFININADYNIGKYNSITAGLMVVI